MVIGYYSSDSLDETKNWLTKAFKNKLLHEAEYKYFIKEIVDVGVKLNNHVKSIGK